MKFPWWRSGTPGPPFRSGLRRSLLPLLLLAIAVALVAWPQAGTWTGTGGRLGLWAWRDWWFDQLWQDMAAGRTEPGEAVSVLLTGGVGPDLFSPVDLYLFSLPCRLLGAGAAAWNLKVALVLAANALGGYLLGFAVSRNCWGALLAGALLAFNPTVLGQLEVGAARDALWAFPALFAASLMHLDPSGPLRRLVWTALALVGCFLTTWLAGVLALGVAGLLLLAGSLPLLRGNLRRALVGLAGVLLLVGIFYSPLATAILQGAYPFSWPAALAGPQEVRMVGGHRAIHEGSRSLDFLVHPQHPEGLNPLLLAILLVPLARGTRGWYLVAATGFLLILGPYLRTGPLQQPVLVAGNAVPLPFLFLYHWLPGMTWVKSPAWFAPLMYLGLAALGARHLEAVGNWFKDQPLLGPLVALVVLGVTGADLTNRGALPLRHVRMEPPALYASLDPRADRLIESPGTGDRNALDFYQSATGIPTLGGAADREAWPGLGSPVALANRTPEALVEVPFLRYLLEPGRFPTGPDPRADLEVLARAGYTHVAVHESMTANLSSGARTFDRMLATLTPLLGPPRLGTETIDQFPRAGGRLAESPQPRVWRLALFTLRKGSPQAGANSGR